METSIHLHGSWLVSIGNVQINFGVIWHFVLSFSYVVDRKCWKLTPIVSSCWRITPYLFVEKVLTIVIVLNSFLVETWTQLTNVLRLCTHWW